MNTTHRGVLLAVIAGLALACRTAPVLNVSDAPVPPGLTTAQVREAITRAAAQRGWSITDAGPGHLVADLRLRGNSASVDIVYSERSYGIHYRDSQGLRYNGTDIHKNYNGWVINLKSSIERELASTGSASPRPSS